VFVYLAHPIDQAGHSSWLGSMLGSLNALLVQAGIGAFRPGMAYLANTGDPDHARRINGMNNIAIHQADALVAVLPADVPTLGTPVEIGFALSMGRPVVIFTDIAHSVQLAAWVARGAVVLDMSAEDFEWPTPEQIKDHLAVSAIRTGGQMTILPDAGMLIKPPPFLVTGQAANASGGKYHGDAGIDLAISHECTLEPGEYRLVGTGVYGAIPEGFWGLITGRSSTWARYRCDVRQAVIDHGYRGELMLGIENRGQVSAHFQAGQRLGQIVILPVFEGGITHVNELPDHERGENGYGSSDFETTQVIEVDN
jgi:dUTP pyrophosphatase